MQESQYILDCLSSGRYSVTLHAKQRMAQRGVSHTDIMSCGSNGVLVSQQEEKFKVVGNDLDGDELTLICVLEGNVLIITVF